MLLKNLKINVPEDKVLLRLKYNLKKSEMTKTVQLLIDNMVSELRVLAEAKAIVEDFQIHKIKEDVIYLENTDFLIRGKNIVNHLKGSYKISLFVCTIGMPVCEYINELLLKKEISKATVLDAIASETADALAQSVNDIINQSAKAERAVLTSRYSPGYAGWDLSNQKNILCLLNSREIGVVTNDSFLMIPEKSITACVGWMKMEYGF